MKKKTDFAPKMKPQILVHNFIRHVELIARTELQPTKKQKIDEFNLI